LVRGLVEAYGGRITLSSPGMGQGTTVDVWWPLRRQAQARNGEQ
jgi:signal transduction histidine kinase